MESSKGRDDTAVSPIRGLEKASAVEEHGMNALLRGSVQSVVPSNKMQEMNLQACHGG
jgi:hypothetical protein